MGDLTPELLQEWRTEATTSASLTMLNSTTYARGVVLDLLNEVERLRKDKERLDWLERRATSLDWNLWNSTVTTLDRNTYEGDSWREAIDAAMEASK